MLNTLRRSIKICKLTKVNCDLLSLEIVHIHKEYSRPSLSDYLDNYSELAVYLLAKITHLLTHSFQVANNSSFQFYGHTLRHCHTNGNVSMVMCLFYPPTSCNIEDHIDIIPSMDIDTQLLINLVVMIEKACPGCSIQYHCCIQPLEIPV